LELIVSPLQAQVHSTLGGADITLSMIEARVYCNCIEAGKLRTPPKPHWRVTIAEDGSVEADCLDPGEAPVLHGWWEQACEHKDRQLVYHCLGNIAMAALLREEFGRVEEKCPLMLGRVVYNGIHGGDFLTFEQVRQLSQELRELDGLRCANKSNQPYINRFLEQMQELVAAALAVSKPIAF
jgi:hypothetical protein